MSEPIVNIFRTRRSSHGSEGILSFGSFHCYSLELPWKDNRSNVSCIPPGTYHVKIRISPKYGRVYWVTKVKGRTYILMHSGNYAGEIEEGLKSHTNGCLLLGRIRGWLAGQRAVLCSRPTVRKFMSLLGGRDFTLNIMEAF
jgi:hypothetical protein